MLRIIDLNSLRSRVALSNRRIQVFSVAIIVSVSMGAIALADPISYGNFSGTTVDYLGVTENSGTDPLLFPPNLPGLGLFGAPTVAGDFLDFSPNNFFADNQFATFPGFDLTDGLLTFGVKAKPGKAITNISFQEGGGLSVVGAGTDATFVDVSAVGFINVLEIDGVSKMAGPIPIDLTFNFGSGGDGTWGRGTEGFVNGFRWTGAQFIDINQWLIANTDIDPQFGATKITVTIDNSLYAQSEATAGAYIDKKDFGGLSVTVNAPVIPEPATWMLALVGAVAGFASRRSGR